MSLDALMDVIAYNELPVTLSGGDPLFHPEQVAQLTARIKDELGYNIWLYTGFTWEQIVAFESAHLLNINYNTFNSMWNAE